MQSLGRDFVPGRSEVFLTRFSWSDIGHSRVAARTLAFIGDENAGCAPALSHTGSSAMQQQRRRFKQLLPLEGRLAQEAKRLREEAESLPPGRLRDEAIAGHAKRRPALT